MSALEPGNSAVIHEVAIQLPGWARALTIALKTTRVVFEPGTFDGVGELESADVAELLSVLLGKDKPLCPIPGHRSDDERRNCCAGRVVIEPEHLLRFRAFLPAKLRGATVEYSLCPAAVRKALAMPNSTVIQAADILYAVVVPFLPPRMSLTRRDNNAIGWQCRKCSKWHEGKRPVDQQYRCRRCGCYQFRSSEPIAGMLRMATNSLPIESSPTTGPVLSNNVILGGAAATELRIQLDVGATLALPGKPEVKDTPFLCRIITNRPPNWMRFFELFLGPDSTQDPSQFEVASHALERVRTVTADIAPETPAQICIRSGNVFGFSVHAQPRTLGSMMYRKSMNYLAWLTELTVVLYGEFSAIDSPAIQRATHWCVRKDGDSGFTVFDVDLPHWVWLLKEEILRNRDLAGRRSRESILGTTIDRMNQYAELLRNLERAITE